MDLFEPNKEVIEILKAIFPSHTCKYTPSKIKERIISAKKAKLSGYQNDLIENTLQNIDLQFKSEQDSYRIMESRGMNEKNATILTEIYDDWVAQLTEAVHNKIVDLTSHQFDTLYTRIEQSSPKSILPYLTLFTPETYANLIAKVI